MLNKPSSSDHASSQAMSYEAETSMIEEMRKLREENNQGHKQTSQTLERLEKAMTDIKGQLGEHKQRICELEGRVKQLEEAGPASAVEASQRCVLRYLLQRDAQQAAVCDDLQNRLRTNNVRVFQVPEGSEQGDVGAFVKQLLPKVLKLPPDLDIKIKRAHRSLLSRPTDPPAPPRSLIVRFLDAVVESGAGDVSR